MIPLLALCALAHSLQRYFLVLSRCWCVCMYVLALGLGGEKRGDDCIRVNVLPSFIYLPIQKSCIYLFISPRRRSAGERSHSPAGKYLAFCFVWHLFAISKFAYNNIAYVHKSNHTNQKKLVPAKNIRFGFPSAVTCAKPGREIRFLHWLGWGFA